MCFFSSPSAPEPAPPPAAPPAANPVQSNTYDPSTPESGMAQEKGAASKKAAGTSQLQVELDPTTSNMGSGSSGLQINN